VYIEAPKLFGPKSGKELVLLLLKSIYGLNQALLTFYEKLRDGILERGFTQSEIDPCLFMKKVCICVVYVDDTIFAGPYSLLPEKEIKSLRVKEDQCDYFFQLRDDGEVGDFLGIKIEKQKGNSFLLTQTGLIEKVIKAGGMEDCNKVSTPAETPPVGADLDGLTFNETWEYASLVGMIMYLASNNQPYIAYTVRQAARYSHGTNNSHAIAVKRIIRYLKGTAAKGIIFNPNKS
jgi:hypothetical protein